MNTFDSSIDEKEIAKFTAMADEWWDENGKFKPLHKFNPVRIDYIKQQASEHFATNNPQKPLEGLKILDIGCGGGLLSEPMARLGADVTAIDAAEKNITIASLHAEKMGIAIDYRHTTVEDLVKEKQQFDIVLNMEVVEHVADVEGFLTHSSQLVKPNGLMFVATLNRTAKSFAFAIVGAEYVLRWLPRGTHEWKKFLKPSEIEFVLAANAMQLKQLTGVTLNPLTMKWNTSSDIAVNYMMLLQRLL